MEGGFDEVESLDIRDLRANETVRLMDSRFRPEHSAAASFASRSSASEPGEPPQGDIATPTDICCFRSLAFAWRALSPAALNGVAELEGAALEGAALEGVVHIGPVGADADPGDGVAGEPKHLLSRAVALEKGLPRVFFARSSFGGLASAIATRRRTGRGGQRVAGPPSGLRLNGSGRD